MPETVVLSERTDLQSPVQSGLQAAFEKRACPCCGDSTTVAGYRIHAQEPAEDRTFDDIKQTWQHFFRLSSFFSYFRCAGCGQLYCPRFFNLSQLIALYGRMSDNTGNLPVAVVGKTQRRYFDLLRKFSATKGSYLEFGPDIGLLTAACVENGSFNEMTLIEPNIEVHAALDQAVGQLKHRIFADMNAYREVPDGSLDTITMIHVLDHLLEPSEILQTLKRKLKKGGKILIVTHDESSLMAKVLGARWPAYCLQHPQLYNPKSITTALEKRGFKVLAVQKTYNYFPVTYLAKHLLWALRIGNIPLPNWYWLTIPLRLGNIATIAVA